MAAFDRAMQAMRASSCDPSRKMKGMKAIGSHRDELTPLASRHSGLRRARRSISNGEKACSSWPTEMDAEIKPIMALDAPRCKA